jgi:hypothetical protein
MISSLSSFASSGAKQITLVLDQPDVEALEAKMEKQGYTLSNIKDNFAVAGVAPRCPCTSLELTYSRGRGPQQESKAFGVSTQGFGTNLEVTIVPKK